MKNSKPKSHKRRIITLSNPTSVSTVPEVERPEEPEKSVPKKREGKYQITSYPSKKKDMTAN